MSFYHLEEENDENATAADGIFLWQDIDVISQEKKLFLTGIETKENFHILKKVSGQAKSGRLLAVMGASGSGKTTLMNALTGRLRSDMTMTGSVVLNGRQLGAAYVRKFSAYVQQDDLFIGSLTVREHLWFQAMLRMNEQLSKATKQARIDQVISEMGLAHCQNTLIGTPDKIKAISGGERKRLSFASEIITGPLIIFCDEPTSGLDSFLAENVVQTLRKMASQGKTVICTIHQPSSLLFSLFDDLLLMVRGHVAYAGKLSLAANFFSENGFVCPPSFNPADFYINTLAIVPGDEEKSLEKIENICKAFEEFSNRSASCHHEGNTPSTTRMTALEIDTNLSSNKPHTPTVFKTGCFNQFRYTFWRYKT